MISRSIFAILGAVVALAAAAQAADAVFPPASHVGLVAPATMKPSQNFRGFEDRVQSLFLKGQVHGTTHLCSGQEAVAHFGLGKEEKVDLEITLPHGKGKVERKDVKANQRVTVKP